MHMHIHTYALCADNSYTYIYIGVNNFKSKTSLVLLNGCVYSLL